MRIYRHIVLLCSLCLPLCLLHADGDDPDWVVAPYWGTEAPESPDPDWVVTPYWSAAAPELPDPDWVETPYYIAPLSELTIEETGLPDNIEVISAAGLSLTLYVERSLVGGMYNTLCLPFDVPSLVGTPLEGSDLLSFTSAVKESGGSILSIYFERVTSIEAGKPYLIMPPADVPSPMEFSSRPILATEGVTLYGGGVNFIGVLEPFRVPDDGRSLCVGSGNRLYYVDGTTNMKGMRAYFYVDDGGAHLPARIRIGGRVPTDIAATELAPASNNKYVVDGNVYIRDGAKVYSITGNIVW